MVVVVFRRDFTPEPERLYVTDQKKGGFIGNVEGSEDPPNRREYKRHTSPMTTPWLWQFPA
jgi:hypothetical protein